MEENGETQVGGSMVGSNRLNVPAGGGGVGGVILPFSLLTYPCGNEGDKPMVGTRL